MQIKNYQSVWELGLDMTPPIKNFYSIKCKTISLFQFPFYGKDESCTEILLGKQYLLGKTKASELKGKQF